MVAVRIESVGLSGSLLTGYPPHQREKPVAHLPAEPCATSPPPKVVQMKSGDHEHACQFLVPACWPARRAAELFGLANN